MRSCNNKDTLLIGICCLIVSFALVGFTGCANIEANSEVQIKNSDEKTTQDDAESQVDSEESLNNSENRMISDSLTLEQILSSQEYKYFIQRGEEFYPLSVDVYSGGGSSFNRNASHLTQDEEHQGNGTPVIAPSQGDRIVTTQVIEGNKLSFYPVVEKVYTKDAFGSWSNVEEINGIEIDSMPGNSFMDKVRNCLTDYGITLTDIGSFESEEPVSFLVGRFEGTQYIEDMVHVAVPSLVVYFGGDSYSDLPDSITLPVEKTKEGYFYIDVSSLSTGSYAIHNEYAKKNSIYNVSVFDVQ